MSTPSRTRPHEPYSTRHPIPILTIGSASHQYFRGFDRGRNVGKQRLLVADYLQLDHLADADLARQPAGADRFLGRVASGGVRQNLELGGIEEVEQVFLAAIGDIDAAHRDRDNLGAAFLDRATSLGEILVLAGADDKP